MISAVNNHVAPRLLPLRLPRICVAIAASGPAELEQRAEGLARDNSFLELRLDYLPKPALALPRIKRFLETHPHVIVIATCRRTAAGGKFGGSIANELDLLAKAAAAGCQLIDLELQTAQRCKPAQLQKLRSRAALLLSHHDFQGTHNLEETFAAMAKIPADFYKVVSTAKKLHDNVEMMKLLQEKGDRHTLIGLCMGEQGTLSRVLGLRAGSAFTFAALNCEEKTAPGQITAQEMRSTYRVEQVDAATRVYGVVGNPIAHSLSPVIMNAALRRENVNGVYLGLQTKSLKDLLACVREIPLHGLSVTMPYKQEIVQYLDNSDALTAKIGACNTVVRGQDGKLYGFNTDAAGILRPLEQRLTISGAKVLILGAGGAAHAAAFALKERGAEIYILNRNAQRGQKLARRVHARTVKRVDLKKLSFDVIIHATPVGTGNTKESPLNENEINAKFVFDMVYDPVEPRLLTLAKQRGAQVIPGIEMFVHQAARQFEIWTGKPAPWDEMLRVVMLALQERTAARIQNEKYKKASR
jgi:3-dehydroquinate dehydratase / shikimate dehydrogenase